MQLHLVGKVKKKKEIMQSVFMQNLFSHGVHSKGNYFCQQVSRRFKLFN